MLNLEKKKKFDKLISTHMVKCSTKCHHQHPPPLKFRALQRHEITRVILSKSQCSLQKTDKKIRAYAFLEHFELSDRWINLNVIRPHLHFTLTQGNSQRPINFGIFTR